MANSILEKRKATTSYPRTSRAQIASDPASTTTDKEKCRSQGGPASVNAMMDKKPLESDPYTYYQLIGECYVDGMMGGKALSQSHTWMLFEIR
ncbi:uncharacterized protein F4817DRAFT_318196 [Daldinia loculata]|uniref:uncharacterized protein n=1 Tax=Daldinia loculata TaxID=103429 RepID=UPI0020C52F0F|nr:uncharacterized protein F4817DRAFT_318196 [Daldinia loculata]KAI1645083.1 hypothetical protein F4817DRAFT_318196 [Daldinia loculata]